VFLLDGTVTKGPAVDPLPSLPFTFRAAGPGPGTITIDQLGFTC
jgi:Rieske Fe-S protein